MNRREKEKLLLDALGLKVGDKVKIHDDIYKIEEAEDEDVYELQNITGNRNICDLIILIFCDFEKIEPKKKYGNVVCVDIQCHCCPLFMIDCRCEDKCHHTLYEILDSTFDTLRISKNCNLYKALKEELDKEVDND